MSTFARFDAPKPRSLTDDVYDVLREVIYCSDLIPGSWLREETLAGELSVSRITIRTALNHLVAEGLAERIPNKGVKVALLSMDELKDVYDMRVQLERLAFESAADRITEAELEAMEALISPFKGPPTPDAIRDLVIRSREFHWMAIKASRRSQLVRVLRSLLDISMSHGIILMAYKKGYTVKEAAALAGGKDLANRDKVQEFYRDYVEVVTTGDLEHEAILDALRARDRNRAGQLIVSHLHRADEYLD